MNATINNTTAAYARKEFEKSKALKVRWDAEIAAGRYFLEGPSFVGSVGDGYSTQVPTDSSLRAEFQASQNYLAELLDTLTARNTGFTSFVDLVEAQRKHGYRPSFYEAGNEEIAVLADAYDYVAGLWGLPEKSYRPEQHGRSKVRRRKV